MKILVITEEFGKSANGLVAENIVKGLVRYADVDILTDKYNPKDDVKGRVYICKKINKYRIQQWSIMSLGIDVLSHWWPLVMPKGIRQRYDLILSVISMSHYAPLRIGWEMKKKYGGRFFAYFVDAVPAPEAYLKNQKYREKIPNYINRYCDNVEVIFSATQEMSDYQASIVQNSNTQFVELYNPSKTNDLVYFPKKSKDIVFTYTGNIYPPRNPEYLLEAFARFVGEYPNARLQIIGNKIINYLDSFIHKFPENVQHQICQLPFQTELNEVFMNSTALIDIGCDVENDVYMSNKINGYFSYCRPIICETSVKSPAARIFRGMKTVFICNHDAEEIFNAMVSVLSYNSEFDYSERYRILKEMSINGVTDKIMNCYYES